MKTKHLLLLFALLLTSIGAKAQSAEVYVNDVFTKKTTGFAAAMKFVEDNISNSNVLIKTYGTQTESNGLTINKGNNITVEGDGLPVTVRDWIQICSGTSLTLINCNLRYTKDYHRFIQVNANAKLTIYSGYYESTTNVIFTEASNSEITIYGGSFVTKNSIHSNLYVPNAYNTIKIYGGKFYCTTSGSSYTGGFNIAGGVKRVLAPGYSFYNGSTMVTDVSSEALRQEVVVNPCNHNSTSGSSLSCPVHGSVDAEAEVILNGKSTYFESLKYAMTSVQQTNNLTTVKMRKDIEIPVEGIVMSKGNVTLDLNGHSLKKASYNKYDGQVITVNINYIFTVDDTSAGTIGYLEGIDNTDHYCTLKGGRFKNLAGNADCYVTPDETYYKRQVGDLTKVDGGYVAQVGQVKYKTLDDAKDYNRDPTIKLLANISTYHPCINEGETIIIDGQGKSITAISFSSSGNLTLKDVTINPNCLNIFQCNGGSLTMENSSITNLQMSYSGNTSLPTLYMSSGSNLKFLDCYDGATINITGGTVNNFKDYGHKDITISGNPTIDDLDISNKENLKITGGAFGNDVNKYLGEGYIAQYIPEEDNYFHVTSGRVALIKPDGRITAHESIKAAIAEVNNSKWEPSWTADEKKQISIKLVKTFSEPTAITIPSNAVATVNAQDYILQLSNPITVEGGLTIENGTLNNITSNKYEAIIINSDNACLTINGTKFINNFAPSISVQKGSLVMNSGYCDSLLVTNGAKSVHITGGELRAIKNETLVNDQQPNPRTVEITGGVFSFSPTGHNYYPTGSYYNTDEDSIPGKYLVLDNLTKVKLQMAGSETKMSYSTFEAAVIAAQSGTPATIYLVDNYTTSSNITISENKNITVKKLNKDDQYVLTLGSYINVAGTLTIDTCTINNTDKTIGVSNGGVINLNPGSNVNAITVASGIANVNGGTCSTLNITGSAARATVNEGSVQTFNASNGASASLAGGVINSLNVENASIDINDAYTGTGTDHVYAEVQTISAKENSTVSVSKCKTVTFNTTAATAKINITDGNDIVLPSEAKNNSFTITGGIFKTYNPKDNIDDTYYSNAIDASHWKVLPGCVAKIGENKYTTFAAALAEANKTTNPIIEIVADCVADSVVMVVNSAKEVTIKSQGHTIDVTKDIRVYGTLSIVGNSEGKYIGNKGFISVGGNIIINGDSIDNLTAYQGTITINPSAKCNSLFTKGSNNTINVNGGSCQMAIVSNDTETTFTSTSTSPTNFTNGLILLDASNVTIDNGQYKDILIDNNASLTLNGGQVGYIKGLGTATINIPASDKEVVMDSLIAKGNDIIEIASNKVKIDKLYINDDATCLISGGQYNSDPNSYVISKYYAPKVESASYKWTVGSGYKCSVDMDDNMKKFTSLVDAIEWINDINKPATVQIEDNINWSSDTEIAAGRNIIINGVDKSATTVQEKTVILSEPLTVKGELTLNKGIYKAKAGYTDTDKLVCVEGGTLRINGSTVDVNNSSQQRVMSRSGETGDNVANAIVVQSGTLNITGGTFKASESGNKRALVVRSDVAHVAVSGGTFSGTGGSIAWGQTQSKTLDDFLDAGCRIYESEATFPLTKQVALKDKTVSTSPATVCNAIIPSIQYSTVVARGDLDFTGSDVTAYMAESIVENDSAKIKLVPVSKASKGTPLVVFSENAGGYSIPTVYDETVEGLSNNRLVACLEETVVASTTTDIVYLLNNVGGKAKFVEVDHNPNTVARGRAYLSVPYDFVKDGVFFEPTELDNVDHKSTGINNIHADGNDNDAPTYNLAGQRINKTAARRTIVIRNGRKYVVK